VPAGYSYLVTGDFRLNVEQPPLLKELAALPLLVDRPRLPLEHPSWGTPDYWSFGRAFLFEENANGDELVFRARLPLIALATAFCVPVFLWARDLAGPAAGLAALILYAFEPTVLANAEFVAFDEGCGGFAFLFVYLLWRHMRRPSIALLVAAGTALGLSMASKYTAVVFVPLVPVFCVAARARIPAIGATLLVLAAAAAVISAAYGMHFGLPLWLEGIRHIYPDRTPGYEFFLLGRYSPDGWWYYYLAAFVLKATVPFLLAIAVGVAVVRQRRPVDLLFLLAPVVAMFGASTFDVANLGVRRILPVFPFLAVFAGAALAAPYRAIRYAVALLCVAQMVTTVRVFPDHLAFFNALCGGPSQGIRCLDDSNIDWGQDLKGLKEFIAARNIHDLALDYFGTYDPAGYGIRYRPITPEEIVQPRAGHWYAVSVHNLQRPVRVRFPPPTQSVRYEWLDRYEPVTKIGYSIYVYRF